jgi:hypothetical protein
VFVSPLGSPEKHFEFLKPTFKEGSHGGQPRLSALSFIVEKILGGY